MSKKYKFVPDPSIQGDAILPASLMAVYASNAVPGAITVAMASGGVVQAGTRLTRDQAAELATALIELIGEADVDSFTLGRDMGYAAGYREGYRFGLKDGKADA